MTYLSGLMLGASLANMARQMILGTGGRPAEGNILHGLGGGLFAAPERSRGKHPHVLAHTEAPSAMPVSCAVPTAVFSCVHASPGRRRYRTPYLTEAFAKVLEERLLRLPFIRAVRTNTVSGSILLSYAPEDEAHVLVLAEGLCAIFAEGKVQPPATLAKSVRRSVESLSAWIQRNTGGALDLSSLVAGVFIMRGVRQLVISNNTPSGSQMLWWALSLMRGWKV